MTTPSGRKPMPTLPIATKQLPRICPACGNKELGTVDTFGVWKVTCHACAWSERYQVTR